MNSHCRVIQILMSCVVLTGAWVAESSAQSDAPWETSAAIDVLTEAADDYGAGRTDAAIRRLKSALEDDQIDPSQSRMIRNQLAIYYQGVGDYQSAIDELTSLIKTTTEPYERYSLLTMRVWCWEEIGDDERARSDEQEIEALASELGVPVFDFSPVWIEVDLGDWLATLVPEAVITEPWFLPVAVSLFAALVWLGCVLSNLWFGYRQMREGEGTFSRLAKVCALAGLLQIAPLLAVLALTPILSDVWSHQILSVGLLSLVICVIVVTLILLPPARWLGSQDELPLIEDLDVIEGLRGIAQRLGIRSPVARKIPSCGGNLAVMGFAGGLPAPSIAISDGILLRLTREERNAILAHELAHIANASLWFYPGVFSLSGVVAVLVSLKFSVLTSICYGLAFYAGAARIVSRYLEYDCDRRAAQIVGHRTTVTALDKIHVAGIIENAGWKSFFAYAMATHPSHEERLAAIAENAPDEDILEVTWSPSRARLRHRGSLAALALWAGVMVGTLFVDDSLPLGFIFAAIFLLPTIAIQFAIRKDVRVDLKRRHSHTSASGGGWLWLTVAALTIGGLNWSVDELDLGLPELLAIVSIAVAVVLVLIVKSLKWGQRDLRKIGLAIHQHRWADALALGAKRPKRTQKDPAVRHDLALCKWMMGDRNDALQDMSRLRDEFPKFKQTWVTEALMRLQTHELSNASDLAHELADKQKNDIVPWTIIYQCRRLQGDLDGAREAVETIAKISPDTPFLTAAEARFALEQGDIETLWELLAAAHKKSPGDPGVILLEAEAELRQRCRETGVRLLAEAKRLMDANPFTFLDWYYDRVEKLLEPVASTVRQDAFLNPVTERVDEILLDPDLPES